MIKRYAFRAISESVRVSHRYNSIYTIRIMLPKSFGFFDTNFKISRQFLYQLYHKSAKCQMIYMV